MIFHFLDKVRLLLFFPGTVISKVGFMSNSQLCDIQGVAVCRFDENIWTVFISSNY